MSSTTIERSKTVDKQKEQLPKNAPKYRVLLHNDDFNIPQHVIMCLHQVAQLSEQTAINVMLTAHTTGIGLIKVCDIEPAEFYQDGLSSKGLTVTIEPEGE